MTIDPFEEALADCERLTGLSLDDLTQIGLRRVVAEFCSTGRVIASDPLVTIDLGPILASLSPEHEEAVFQAASRERMTVGALVKKWIGNHLAEGGPDHPRPASSVMEFHCRIPRNFFIKGKEAA